MSKRRIGVFGWGIVAPKSPNVDAFAENLSSSASWLTPFEGFGPSNFLAGEPDFRFVDYKPWVDQRFPPNRFFQLEKKMGPQAQYAIASFIQALGQNPGIEQLLQELGPRAHVYVGTGLGDLEVPYQATLTLHRAQRRWDRFWADPARNPRLQEWLGQPASARASGIDAAAPPLPETAPEFDRDEAEEKFWHYWATRSALLRQYLTELRAIEALAFEGDVESGKLTIIKERRSRIGRLQKRWGAPEPPWNEVSANLLWNLPNVSAAQISMLGKITGACFAPVASCSTFGYALKFGMASIRQGDADVVVVGATDSPPHPLSVGSFYRARVLAGYDEVSKPLTGLRGTHVAGGAAVWILGDYDTLTARGFRPLGMEPVSVGLSADADHIITPSADGPTRAIREALHDANLAPEDVGSWDLHATATPGDHQEMKTLRGVFSDALLVSARKATFGHGMGACGGWELTAQYLGYAQGVIAPTPLQKVELNPEISQLHQNFVFDVPCPVPAGAAGKMSMGIGGINACVISRPWK